jgi:hypothetical protein
MHIIHQMLPLSRHSSLMLCTDNGPDHGGPPSLINVSVSCAAGMGVSALVQLPAGDARAQRLAGAMQQPLPGSPQQQPQPGLQVAVGNAKMMQDAQVEVPPSAESVLRELEVSMR